MEASLGAVPRPRTRSNSQPSRPAAVVRTKPPLPPTPPPASSTGQRQNKGKGKDGPHVPVPRPSTAGPSEPTVTHGPLSPLSPSSLLARSSSLLVSSRQKLVGRRRRTTSLSASTPPIVVGLPTPPTSPAPVLVPVPVSAARPPEIPPRNPTRGSPRPSAGVGSVGVGARSTAGAGASSRSPVPAPTPSARIPTAVLTRKDANTNADVNTIPIPMHAPIRKRSSSAHRRASTSASPAATPPPPSPPISQFHRPTSAHAHGRSPTTAAAAVPRPADAGLHPISSPPSHSKSSPYLPPVPKGSPSIPPKSSPLLPSKSSSPVLSPKPSPSLPPLPPHPAMVPQHRHPPEVHPHSHLHPPRARFSTADRAILEELRRGLDARQSQFVFKGGARHHAYARASAPYPRNYERVVIDHDVWETAFTRQLCGSLTFHVFDAPPTKVLDLGCGSGTWILECARIWRRCEFVGLDLVPLHPDLSHLRSNDLQRRITWLQANCLDGLPFPDEEFDYVHVKRLALGVPETRWDGLLEEIARVMKPGGALEIIEEDLFFPGRPRNDESGGDGRSSPAPTERSSAASASASASSSSLPVTESPYISAQALRRQHPRSRSPAAPPAQSPSQVAIPRSPALARSPSPARPRVLQKQRAPSLPPPRRSTISIPVATGTGVPPAFVFPRPSAAAAPAGESHKSALPIEGKKLLISAEASAPVDVSRPVHAPRPRVAALVSPLKSPSSPPLLLPRPPSPPLKSTSPPPKPTSLTYHIPSPSHSPKPTSSPAAVRVAPSLQSLFDAIGSTTHNRRRSWIRSRPSTSEGPYTKSSPDVARPADPARPAFIRSASNPAVPSAQAKAGDVDANGQGEHAQSRPAGFSSLAVHIPSASLFEGSDASPLLLTAENAVGRASDRPKTAESGVSSASRTESGVSSSEARLSTVESRTSDSEAKTGTVESKASDVELMDSRAEPGLKSELAEPHAESGTPSSPVVVPKPFVKPQDPHDHSLLEHIYNETHAERWINLAPLSLLANALPLYFKDVRTHPPIMFMFPPRASSAPHKPSYRSSPAKRATVNGFPHSGGSDTLCLDSSDDDTPQDSRLTLNTQDASFERGQVVIPNVDAAVPSVPDGVIHGREILRETQPFVLLDGTAPGPALSSARPRPTQSLRHAADSHRRVPHDDSLVPNRLPNKTLAFDLQSLNLHLSTRVTEIVACREAMWEWVLRRREAGRGRQPRVERGVEPFEAELLGMTRVEFDALLRRFEMDMRDNVALDARLHGTFGWPHPTPSPRSSEQREYDQACARWDAYVRGLPPDAPEQRREIARRASPRLSRTIRVFCAWR